MKTLKEFDYDLWAIEENGKKRYFARVKATGEEAEITIEVMRLLLSQEKQMRREYARQQIEGTILSLNAICDSGNVDEAAWEVDAHQNIDSDLLWADIKDEFCKMLSDRQRSVFNECLIEGNTLLPSSSGFITPCTVEKVPFSRGFSNFLDSIVCPPVPSGSGQKL